MGGRACGRCGCPRDAHDHYRAGQECALCECPGWRRAWPWTRASAFPDRPVPGAVPSIVIIRDDP